MREDTITLALNGRVTLEAYTTAIGAFTELVHALQAEVSPKFPITWELDDLQISSAMGTIRGTTGEAAAIERVTRAYASVGRALAREEPVPFSPRVKNAAKRITSVISEDLPSVRFETAAEDATVVRLGIATIRRPELEEAGALGAIAGRIQTVSNRVGIHFTLYDNLHDRAVSCYLTEDSQERLRGLWGTRVVVHGLVRRDPMSGRPVVVRQVSKIDPIVPDEPDRYAYLRAKGAIPARAGAEKPEDILRRLRDAR